MWTVASGALATWGTWALLALATLSLWLTVALAVRQLLGGDDERPRHLGR